MAGPSNIYFTTPLWTPGTLTRVPALDKTLGVPVTQNQQQSPFAVITKDVSAAVASALEEFGPGTTVKVFVTGGVCCKSPEQIPGSMKLLYDFWQPAVCT